MSGVIYPINDRKYTAEDVEIFNCTRTSGVFSVLDFDCSLSGNVVTIGKGLGWLKNGDFSGKAVAFKDITNLTLDGADSAFDRYDVVAVRYDATKKDPEIVVIKGEAGESPVMPKRSTESYLYELFLYSILRKAGESTVSFENVTDLRENKNYCGIMEDSVTSAVAPVYETIVENTELKVNDKLDFDYEKYEYLIATLRMSFTDCDVILTKSYPSGSGIANFYAFSGIGSVANGSTTFYFRAQIKLSPNSTTGHSVASSQWLNNPNFTALEDNATIIKVVGVTKQPKGYVAVDDVYNPESHNAQSGQAISMALSGVLKASKDYTRIYVEDNLGVVDVAYDPTSDNAQSGKAVAEALVSKQDALIDGENVKTINGQSILGAGDIVIESEYDTNFLKERFDDIDLNTLSKLPRANGYIANAGTWNNVSALYQHVIIPVAGGEKLRINKGAIAGMTIACLTEYPTVINGNPVPFSSDSNWGKRIDIKAESEYTIPADAQYLFIAVTYNGADCSPSMLVVGDYDYLSSGRANIKSISQNAAKAVEAVAELNKNAITVNDLYKGFTVLPEWESGSITANVGQASSDGANVYRQRSNYITFPAGVKIAIGGIYKAMVITYDENLLVATKTSYVKESEVAANTPFRLVFGNVNSATDDISTWTSEDVNEFVSITSDSATYLFTPDVRWCALGDSITEGHISYYRRCRYF